MDEMKSLFACLLLLSAVFLHSEAKETEVWALVGSNVILPCRVDTKQCGTLHSVKWYKDTSRIYVFSQAGQIRRGEGDATERMNVTYNEAQNETLLQISSVKLEDEATYKCEITYLEVGENCDVVQIVKLTAVVKPTDVILTYNGKEVNESTSLEERIEGEEAVLTCKAPGGKPIPYVSWYNGTKPMNRASYSSRSDGSDSTGTGISKLQLTLTRYDLNARFECKVESRALDEPITRGVSVPVKVAPTGSKLSGVNGQVTQGTIVTLLCEVFGARPMAEVEWYNNTLLRLRTDTKKGIKVETSHEEKPDGTFTTKSRLSFTASRFDDSQRFVCDARNEVMVIKKQPKKHELIKLIVFYPPVITIGAIGNTIVNESANITLTCNYMSNPANLEGATWIKDGRNLTKIHGKHRRGDRDVPDLTIIGITREDMGEYSCMLQNAVNSSVSEDVIFLDVHYPPDVEIIMMPPTPANATDQSNVTLLCNVTSGNPPSLRKVRWFLDGELMAELPECNYSQSVINDTLGGPFCGIDPSILSLIKVEQSFAGNYTCQGENEAGIGPVSDPKELIVYYPPSTTRLTHFPQTVIKRAQVTLTCSVEDTGFPTDVTYVWFRNGHMVHNVTVSNWTITQASLETRSNFSCIALNKGGQSRPAFDFVNVVAPPALITKDNAPYKGVLFSSQNMSLNCRIECFPLCSIKWYKDGHEINFSRDSLYYVINTTHPADVKKNDFESIESTLVWNMTSWPDHQLDKRANDSKYTCTSYDPSNRHKVGVNFTTVIGVEYPPENLTLSQYVVNVIENHDPNDVKCSGDGRPILGYVWKKTPTSEPIMKGDTLKLTKMPRSSAGYYFCEAFNRYGNKTIHVEFNVWYKPECTIKQGNVESNPSLICRASGNPSNMTFYWTMIDQNRTVDLNPSGVKSNYSYYFYDNSITNDVKYQCVANNTIDVSDSCSITISGNKRPWYLANLPVIIASIITLIVCFLIVCIVIIILCRKKRQNTKSPNPSSAGDKTKLGAAPPVGGSADPSNDHDKGFYENLPFHGMQNPPNKTNGTTTTGSDTYIF